MIRISVYTDEPTAAIGLASVLAAEGDFLLAGILDSLAGIAHGAEMERPDLLLVDMAGGAPVSQIEDLRHRAPGCKVVCWTRSLSFEMAIHLVEMGVQGILPKTVTGHLLCGFLRKIAGGEQCIDNRLFSAAPAHSVKLTGREQQILALVSLGMKNREMATALSISEGTLKVYVSRLLQKTGLRDRHQLALYRLRNLDGRQITPGWNGRATEQLYAH